ncbi:MAG: DinB family protein [Chloroflexota bacterium]|nr:DinB family protein [Chloroflexota bacterium]
MPVPTPEQLEKYEKLPFRIAGSIDGLTEAQFHHKPAEGEWSIHEVLIHLADSEMIGSHRLRKTIAEEHPTLQGYDEAAWAKNLAYQTQNRELALDLFKAQHLSTAALLRTLSPQQWERTALHSENGEMSLYDIFLVYLDHGQLHLAQIERLNESF